MKAQSRAATELSASDMLAICDSLLLQIASAEKNYQKALFAHIQELVLPHSRLRQDTLSQIQIQQSSEPDLLSPEIDSLFAVLAQTPAMPMTLDSIGYIRRVEGARREASLDYAITTLRNQMTATSGNLYTIDNQQNAVSTYMVEVHKKYALPFACFFFVLVGVPLGVLTKRGGFGVGAGLSLIFFLLYWIFLIGGEKLADRRLLSPAVAMWSGNAVILLIGLFLLMRASGVTFLKWPKKL